jgi:hypothetical protein
MENDNGVSGLLRRRQEIADELDVVQGHARQLVIEIDAVDLTIRLFRPNMEIEVIRVKPIPWRHAALRGESTRMIMGALREAAGPLTTREIVGRVMEARGMNTADKAMCETIRLRLASSLLKLKNRGKVVAEKEGGRNRRWGLAAT